MASEKGILDPHGIPDTESDGNTSFLRAARNGQLEKVLEYLKTNIDINTSNANGLNALHLASKDGHVEIVEELLKRGAIVDAATKKGNTALHIASLAGQEEVVKILVQHGASVNVQSQNGFTPLYMAAQENHDNVVKFLLANGANQSLSTEDGFTPLAVAMQQGHDKVVTVLLENDTRGKVRLPALHIAAKKDDVRAAKLLLENDHNPDVTSKSGFTPLHIASHYGNQSIANLLIQKGADVNYSAKHNITPLHVAAKWGKSNMVSLLLEQGAHIEAKTRDGLTPLHCAARSGHEQVVDMLLEKSAPISSKTKNGLAPLHMAAQGDHVDAARILLHHRAPVDEVTVDYLTALHVAAHCGHVRVAKLLLERQADANARALNGFTPLHIACKKNRIKVVELLLKHGACIGATTESGLTPLHVASFMGCMNIVIYLLQNDASPDIPTVRGETPLHLAARANQTDIIRILLRNGAQVDARAREQQTPLHVASRLGNVDIVMLLLQHGAKIDSTTKDMYTALHIAAKEGQDEVAAVLIENGASLNSTTKKGFTPLHLAAKYGHLKVAKLLVQKEAPVDAQGKNGVTPLHVASHYDHQNVALLLLEKGASPHAEAKNGHTPLHIAARKNQMDIANTLLEYGAKPDVESKAGFTPLHLSSQEGHVEISSLLLEHKATPDYQSKNGLTPMHLCAQENQGAVAGLLHKNGANIDTPTKGGYTPLHIASHYGQSDMVKFLLSKGANVKATTSLRYTPLHQAAQQGHANIVNLLLENSAQPNAVTNNGQTPLHIAQKLGYITVIDTLKQVTESLKTPVHSEEKYRVVAPELMHETFLSDSEEEGEDTLLGDQTYRYLTADEMKSLGDDSLPIDVTRDERVDSNRMVGSDDPNAYPPRHIEDSISPEHIHPNYVEYIKKATDNVDITRHPVNIGFLVSFLVDARGGAMRGCRHSGVRVIVPPRCAPSPTRITCRYVRPQRTPHPPPLMEGEALASRVLELGPVGAKFLGPVIIEVPHFAALRGKEREIVILRSDNGESWKEHTVEATEDVLNEVLRDSFDTEDLNQLEDHCGGRTTRIITQDFPQYFAVISRIRQEVHAIGPDGGMVSSTVVPQVQAVFPKGALTKKIKVGLQAQPIDPELTAKLLGHGVAVSPVVTVEPRRRKFHKAITLSMPAPRAHSQGMINQYSGSTTTLRLLCSITGGTSRAQWEDVTGSTPLTFVNDCVSFTTTVSARFWLMDCRNIGDATKMATELYREAIHVPFIAKFVVFAKRIDPLEARLRVFCMTDDKEEKTLEYQEQFTEIAKSRDVEVMEGKSQYIEFVGNLVPITKSGEQLQFSFRAFKENRLPFSVRVKDEHAEAVSRCLFMREPKVQKGEPPQQPICILNIVLPDDIVTDTISLTDSESMRKKYYANENFDYYRQDPRLADISNLLGEDWIELANQLGLTSSEINVIKSEYPDSVAKQAQSMLRMWLSQSGNKVQTNTLENALCVIGREDIVNQCLNVDNRNQEILRIMKEEKEKYRLISDRRNDEKFNQEKISKEEKMAKSFAELDKYSAEEKTFEPSDEEEDFNKTVPERREQIVKRLSTERAVPASSQRVEIVQEITSIKRQSLVEDKIAEVQQKANIEPMKLTTIKPVSKIIQEKMSTAENKEQRTTHIEQKSEQISKILIDAQNMEKRDDSSIHNLDNKEKPDRRDSVLLEEVTQLLETKKPLTRLLSREDSHSPKFSKTPPPSPADFIVKEKQATTNQEWTALEDTEKLSRSEPDTIKNISDPSCKELTDASQKIPTNIQPPQPRPRHQKSKEQVDEIVIEPTPKQISPVRDDILDDREKIEDISYQDKKKFWENITKEPSKKQSDLSKRNTVHQITAPPKPKPRGALQFSYSVSEATTENTSLIEYKHEDIVVSEEKQSSLVETEEIHSSETQKEKQASDDKVEEMKKTDSVDTEENSSQAEENAGYISDSGDVEHYISDSEIEDRVPQIRERQMSVFVPPSVSQRTRYERSASLPTEDLYEVSARSTKLRKQYYEEQMRKEMIQEQLNIDLEDEGSPERKSLSSPEGKIEKVSTEIPTNERPNISGTIFESEFEQCPEEESKDDQRKFSFEENENREIHVDKSETEKSEKVHSKTASEERPQEKIPEITFTLSGKQRRISEESDEYAVEKIVTISPVPEQVEISEEDQERETKKEEKLLETLTEIEESSIKCQERISEEISFTHEHKQEPEMKKQIEDIEEVLLIASISEDTQKDSLPDGNINEVKELENLKTDYTEPNTNAHSPAESQVEKISVVDQNIEETAEHPKISATEKTLDNELADIDLENEDLKNIVSRLESMHKFKKFKASSKIPVKTKASEKDPNADAPKKSSQHSEGKEEKDEKYCGPVPIPDETKSTKKIGNIEFVENVRDLTFTQVKAVKGEILETCIPQVSVEKDIKPFVSYVDESSKTDEKYVAESEKFHSPTELITTTEENKKAEKETFDKHSEMSEKNVSFSSSEISKQNTEKVYIKSTSSIQETYEILSILKKKSAIKKDLNSPEKEQILSKTYLKPELADLVESHSLRSVQDDKAVSSTDGAESKTEMTKLIDETNEISSKPEWHTRDVTSEEIISSDVGASQLASHSEEDSTNVKATSGENDSRDRSHDDYKTIKQPQENIENTIWEVSVESEVMKEEKLCTFPSCERESADMKSESFSDKVNDENITDETNLDSDKLDSELSDSLRSMKSDNHNDMKRMILESLEQQKVDPEEAKLIAESLIEEIESELQKVENFNRELSSKSDSVESDKHVTDYLKELAEVKGLEQREVELVESVLERRKRQISRLSRGDTQASSMEITDEDLRFSETDYDYSNILQQQMGQLEAQCSDHMKKVYDSLVEDQSAASVSNDDAKLLKQAEAKDIKEEKQIIEEVMKQRKDVILEEDENITEASTDELDLNKMETAIDDSYDSALTKDKIHKKSVKRSEEWTKQVVEKCDEVSEFEQKLDDGVVEKYSTEETEIDETKENEKEAIKRTSSSDSKSSVGSSRTQDDIYSTCSSSKKLESESSAEVVLRRAKREQKKTERKSQIELETYSSSGESHYHSFEIDSKSRPCSSDLEGIVPTGSSEYESALNSQELSMKSQLTSGEYHTAISSLSSKESMMSIESESSGNLASIEISETSETLVPTNSDLEGDIDMADQQMLEDNDLWQTAEPENREPEAEGNLNECSPTSTDAIDIAPKMKRSHEMTFQPEPRVLTSNSPQMEPNDIDERFGTSLDDGSALSVSLSSTSSAQLRTVIELSRTESIGPEESITSAFSDHASLEDDLAKTPENITLVDSSTSTHFPTEDPIESVTILSATVSDNGVMSVCSQVTTETVSTSVDNQKSNHEELKRKGHRRQDSTSFIPTLIHGAPKSSETQKLHDFSPPEITGETTDREFHDLSIRRESGDRRDSHGKSSSTSSEKSSFEEAEAEAAFNMVAHISPVHKIKQICPIMEDIDAEKLESEARENARKEKMEKAKQIRDASPGPIPDIKVTEHLAPLDESNFRYPELEIEREELERESQKSADESHDGEDVPKTDDTENKKNTSDISSYTKEGICENKEIEISESVTKEREPTDKSSNDEERASDSPNSDSFELVEKPDIIDDFVVIEEIGKEASEMDSEGKSMAIQSKPKSHRKHDEEIDAYLARSDPTPLTKITELKYFPPDGNYDLEFEFEDSPPQAKADSSTKEYGSKYDQELEANRKWIEQQFHGDHAAMAAAGYAYEVEFERGPLEDIKEEDINDMDQASSRIGSLGSQKESGGSLGSIKDSYSSTPEYDVLAGRRYFTRSGEHDDISMSSLQEFENLERAMSLETKRMYHGSGSQESSSNGSFKTRYYASKGQGDDISVSSLKEFEGLEKACIAAYKTEVKVKEEEALLSQIEEVQESQPEKQDKETSDRSRVGESDEEDYEKRMFEIDEIIRQAQNNVERFVDLKEAEKTESLGRGDSIEEVSKVPDLDLDTPLDKSATWKEDDPMVASTDSLDLEQIKPIQYGSTDSLDQKNAGMDVMTASTDSIEMNNQLSRNITSDSMENKTDGTNLVCSDSLDIAAAMSSKPQIDSLEEDDQKIFADHSSSDTGKDFSSSVKDDVDEHQHELMLGSTDSLEHTSSTATHATYQYETDSVYSGSFTSGGSITMVSSTDTIDPNVARENIDIAAAVRKVWFDEGTSSSGKDITTEYIEESSMPYVTEVIEPSDDPAFSHTIHRRVQMPVEVRKVTFHGKDADQKLEQFIKDFGDDGEEVHETEEIDSTGNIHTRRVVQKRFVIRPDELAKRGTEEESTSINRRIFEMCPSQLTTLTKTIAGETSQPTEITDAATTKAQTYRRRTLRYDISVDDQTEVDPREHDWLFNLTKDDRAALSLEKESEDHCRQQPFDQYQLSQEMKDLLKEMEEASKK